MPKLKLFFVILILSAIAISGTISVFAETIVQTNTNNAEASNQDRENPLEDRLEGSVNNTN